MTHAQIVAGYSDNALEGIIRQLTISGQSTERLNAAKAELYRREREDAESEDPEQYQENANVEASAPASDSDTLKPQ